MKFEGIKIKGVPCDHGELASDTLGLLIEIKGKTIDYLGDTAFRKDYLENLELHNVDLLIAPINGMFGNLDSKEAAAASKSLKAELEAIEE